MDSFKNSDNQLTYVKLNASNNSIDLTNLIENRIEFNKTKKYLSSLNIFLFFLSEYGFIVIVILAIIISKYIPKYHQSKIINSKTINNFHYDEKPTIFLHMTDIHLSKTRPSKSDGALLFLSSILNYEPDFIIMTGDVVDNFRGEFHWHRVGIQNIDDWNIYKNAFQKLISRFPVIDVAGNHDVWAVDSVISKENKFLDHSFMFNRSSVREENDFILKKIKLFNRTFILFNDYRFPTARPPYGNDPYTSKAQLDLLENMIDELNQEEVFILTHYNIDRMWFIKSSKGHTFEEIVSKENIYAIFTGHRHPNHVEIIHHGDNGGLEFCTSSSFDKKRAGLITIDNNNLVYHDVYIPFPGDEPKLFLTYPVPNDQISSHHIFNLNEFEIRVISFIKDINIKLKISGDIEGELKYKTKLNNGALLFTYPIKLKDGNYKIHIYDENGYSCNINTEFYVGNKFKTKKEKVLNNFNYFFIIRLSFFLASSFIFIIVFPFESIIDFKIISKLEKIINGKDKSKSNNILLLFLLIICLNPFILRKRYQTTKKIIKFAIFFTFIYPLILPIHFFENINGKFGFVTNAFVIIGSSIKYEHWCIQMIYTFYVSVILPYILYLSSFYYHRQSKMIKYINCSIILIIFLFFFYYHIFWMAQAISFLYLILTSGNVICLIFLSIIIYKFQNKNQLNNNTQNIVILN